MLNDFSNNNGNNNSEVLLGAIIHKNAPHGSIEKVVIMLYLQLKVVPWAVTMEECAVKLTMFPCVSVSLTLVVSSVKRVSIYTVSFIYTILGLSLCLISYIKPIVPDVLPWILHLINPL